MKKTLLFIFALAASEWMTGQSCTEPFFSEYLEGASNNKAVEIYNPSSSTINLINYKMYRYNNGSPTPTDSLQLVGTLAPGAVFVAGNPSAVAAILSVSDTLHTITFFNGDDVLALKNITTGTVLDIIGVIGVDPGVNWPVGSGATSEFTLVRMIGINGGNLNWAVAATEYDVYPQNTTTFLGNHTMTPCCSGSVIAQVASTTNNLCFGDNSGTATVSATGNGLTYNWTPSGGTSATATNLPAGTYTCIAMEPCGAADTVTCTITQPAFLDTINVLQTDVLCNGQSNGSITINGSGGTAPYSYLWSNGNTTNSATGLAAGMISYTITDANGCSLTHSLQVVEPSALSSTSSQTNVLCFGGTNGTATVVVSGGTPPYSYSWSSGGTGATENALAAGNYTCTMTDANGCTTSNVIALTEPSAILLSFVAANNPTSCGATDGSIDLAVSGGTAGYSYLWNTSSTTEDISGLGQGAYSVTVTDANGCTSLSGTTLNDPNAPVVSVNMFSPFLCLPASAYTLNGESPSGGVWSGPFVSGNTFDPNTSGVGIFVITYSFTDSSGCTGFATDTIEVTYCVGTTNTDNTILKMEIYPNPSSGQFTVISNEHNITITVVDPLGNEVYRTYSVSEKTEINLGNFAEGIYFVKIEGQNSSVTKRILLNK